MAHLIKNTLLVFCLQFIVTTVLAQDENNDTLTSIVSEMESSNIYEMSYTVGYAGAVSKQYLRFKQLLQLASEKYLSELALNHNNAVLRLYAYQALKHKAITIQEDIAQFFTNDHTVIKTLWGCFGSSQKISILANHDLIFKSFLKKPKVKQ